MEENPTAAPQGTEATQTSTNQGATQEPQATAPEINAEQVAKFLGTDTETFGKFQKFVEANGKFDTAFSKMKSDISNPQPKQEQPVAQPTSVENAQVQQPQQPQPKQTPQGYITQEEYMTREYFKSLSNEEKYAGISEQIRSGEVLKEMSEFGINPTKDGMFNDAQIRKFLDLKAQTVPAQQTTTPITNTPTVEWSNYEKVDSFDAANKILLENINHPGMEHPKTAEAKEFLKNYYKQGR